MKKLAKKGVILTVATALLCTTAALPAHAQSQRADDAVSSEFMIADLLISRPLGLVATSIGILFFTISLPFSASGGNAKEAFQKLVADPANFTFSRPLGQMD